MRAPLPHRREGQGHALLLAAGELRAAVVAAGEDGVENRQIRQEPVRARQDGRNFHSGRARRRRSMGISPEPSEHGHQSRAVPPAASVRS